MAESKERWLTYRNISLLNTGILIKTGSGILKGYALTNNAASARFIKLYDTAAAPAVGTDTPVLTIQLGATSHVSVGDLAAAFTNGIGIGATTAVADNSVAAPSANDLVVNVWYG